MGQNGADSLPPPELSPRSCYMEKSAEFSGYGFNLHAERGKAGQFIGKVDEGSPAYVASLRQGDKIVEVNGVNVLNQNHHQVVTLIRESGDKVTLLVVDKPTEDYYKSHSLIISGDAPNVIVYAGNKTEENGATQEEPAVNGEEEHIEHVETVVAVESAPPVESLPEPEPEPDFQEPPQDYEPVEVTRDKTPSPPPILGQPDEADGAPVEEVIEHQETTVVHAAPEPEPEPEPVKPPTPEPVTKIPQQNGDAAKPEVKKVPPPAPPREELNSLKLSAKEYREMMAKKKDKDARNKAIGFKAKKDAFDNL